MREIKTHEELLKLHGKKISCRIKGNIIDDAKISVDEYDGVYVCQNDVKGANTTDKLGYRHSWHISYDVFKYEEYHKSCTDIVLLEDEGGTNKTLQIPDDKYAEKNRHFFELFYKLETEVFYLKKDKSIWYKKGINSKINKYYYDFIVVVENGIPNAMPVPIFYKLSGMSIDDIRKIKNTYRMREGAYAKRFYSYYKMKSL